MSQMSHSRKGMASGHNLSSSKWIDGANHPLLKFPNSAIQLINFRAPQSSTLDTLAWGNLSHSPSIGGRVSTLSYCLVFVRFRSLFRRRAPVLFSSQTYTYLGNLEWHWKMQWKLVQNFLPPMNLPSSASLQLIFRGHTPRECPLVRNPWPDLWQCVEEENVLKRPQTTTTISFNIFFS